MFIGSKGPREDAGSIDVGSIRVGLALAVGPSPSGARGLVAVGVVLVVGGDCLLRTRGRA